MLSACELQQNSCRQTPERLLVCETKHEPTITVYHWSCRASSECGQRPQWTCCCNQPSISMHSIALTRTHSCCFPASIITAADAVNSPVQSIPLHSASLPSISHCYLLLSLLACTLAWNESAFTGQHKHQHTGRVDFGGSTDLHIKSDTDRTNRLITVNIRQPKESQSQ